MIYVVVNVHNFSYSIFYIFYKMLLLSNVVDKKYWYDLGTLQ